MMKKVKLLKAVCVLAMLASTTTASAQIISSAGSNTYVKKIDIEKLNQQYGGPRKPTIVGSQGQNAGGNGSVPGTYVNYNSAPASSSSGSHYTRNQIEQQVKRVERYNQRYQAHPNGNTRQMLRSAESRLNTMTKRK